jgi:hypothetical protein
VEELNKKINHLAVPYFESVAIEGKGVFESLTMISRMVLKVVKDGAEAHGSPEMAYAPSEAKVADASRVEKRISRPESPRVNQEVPTARPISGPEKDTPSLESPRPSQNAGPARKLRLEKSDPQIETPRPAGIPFSAAAKPERETSNPGGKSLISRISSKKKPEPPAEADEEHKKEILTSKQKTRIFSFGEPRVSSPTNLEIPLTLEVDGFGKKRSFVIAIKIEELEPKVD